MGGMPTAPCRAEGLARERQEPTAAIPLALRGYPAPCAPDLLVSFRAWVESGVAGFPVAVGQEHRAPQRLESKRTGSRGAPDVLR